MTDPAQSQKDADKAARAAAKDADPNPPAPFSDASNDATASSTLNTGDADPGVPVEQAKDAGYKPGDLVVLTSAFVARTDAKNPAATRRFGRGERFTPIKDLHDVEALIRAKVLGRVKDNPRATTALTASQAAATENQETSPVLDLQSVPFEQTRPPGVDADGRHVADES